MSDDNNIAAAMDKVAETLVPTVSKKGKKGSPAQASVLIRTTEETRDRWKQAAEMTGKTMSDFVRDLVNDAADDLIDCPHPQNLRRWNMRAEYCLKCGTQIR